MSELTHETIAELERLEKAATPGPLTLEQRVYDTETGAHCLHACYPETQDDITACREEDMKFIVALRNAAPALITAAKERDRLCRENEKLRDAFFELDIADQQWEAIKDEGDDASPGERNAAYERLCAAWNAARAIAEKSE